MMTEFKMTVIMSSYNQAHFLEQAIESVLSQKTVFDWQLIITDDNSTKDNSAEIIERYVKRYPGRIIGLLNKRNGRYLENVLRAKALTKTQYFCLLDADDYWTDENYLQDAVDFLDRHSDFTIYSRNVTRLNEDGTTRPFIRTRKREADFGLKDFFDGCILVSQTTGTVFRNVIFANGIPAIMTKAIGTISERSFEGDVDRFVMHLKYGRAHFVNRVSGVYRVLSAGIWCRLNKFEKHVIQAQAFVDYDEYFGHEFSRMFINSAQDELRLCLNYLGDPKNDFTFSAESREMFFNVVRKCGENEAILESSVERRLRRIRRRLMRLSKRI